MNSSSAPLSFSLPSPTSGHLHALLDATVEAVLAIDSAGTLTVFNRAAEKAFGYPASEILGQNVRVLITPRDRKDHDRLIQHYQRGGERKIIGTTREMRACRRDGSTFPIKLSVGEFNMAEDRGYVAVIRDISHRYKRDFRLRHTRDQLKLLLEFAPTPIMVTDPGGRIQNANAACLDMIGYDMESIRALRLSELVAQEDHSAVMEDFEQIRGGVDAREREVFLHHQLGHKVPVLLYSGCARDEDGLPLLYIAALLDHTALQQATLEVAALRERLTHAARLGTLGEMVSGIAHEVNQPLSAIATYASACRRMLNAGMTTPTELVDVLDKISRQAERAGQVIRGLRAMVRPQDTQRVRLDLNHLVEEVARLAAVDVRGTAQRLVLDLGTALPRFIGDGVQIQQVLMNLIRNSLEAMRESGSGDEVRVSTRTAGHDKLEIRVVDRGPGLTAAVEARLFDPFVTTKTQGMGLGLSICKSIVNAHAGEVIYQRATAGGAAFIVRLPVADALNVADIS